MTDFFIIAPNLFHGRLEEKKNKWGVGKQMKRPLDAGGRCLIYPYTWAEVNGNEIIAYAGPCHMEPQP